MPSWYRAKAFVQFIGIEVVLIVYKDVVYEIRTALAHDIINRLCHGRPVCGETGSRPGLTLRWTTCTET